MSGQVLKAKDYKSAIKPVWCPGCGHFGILSATTRALAHLGRTREEVAIVSGIGCSSRMPAYTDTYGFHGVHGRALPLATGLKTVRPDLTVIVTGGDGDGFSIGGNHFMHACRRNVDLTYIVMDNEIYGMTKGQASPTTPPDWSESALTPEGPGIRRFNPAAIALASGASFVARAFSGQPNEIARMLVAAIEHPGFAFIQVLSPCPTFRPEQKDWKSAVSAFDFEPTDHPEEASRRVHLDDGFSTGIIFQASLPVWKQGGEPAGAPEDLEEEFAL